MIIWPEDLTHDGYPDRIAVNIALANSPNLTGNEKTIIVYSGKTGKEIFSGHADTIHPGWIGYYVYLDPDTKKTYLLEWKPETYFGLANYSYRIFSLSETGEEIPFRQQTITFHFGNQTKEEQEKLAAFLEAINTYLRSSFVLIDTNGGTIFYSPQNNPLTKEFSNITN